MSGKAFRLSVVVVLLSLVLVTAPSAGAQPPAPIPQRVILTAKSAEDLPALRADVQAQGGTILRELPQLNMLVVSGPAELRGALASNPRVALAAGDQVRELTLPGRMEEPSGAPQRQRIPLTGPTVPAAVTPDPAFGLENLMWSIERIKAPQAWQKTIGDSNVLVAVADSGLDFTHSELKGRIAYSHDLTVNEDPPLCKTHYGYSDADLAAMFGGPEKTDWNGHGTWIGGAIAAALDGAGVNGAAPGVKLVSLKISQWCLRAYDSTMIEAFIYAADHGIDVVNMSFRGYLDRRDPGENAIYLMYVDAVKYALAHGTVIVSCAANDHLRIGAGGVVLTHRPLTPPGRTYPDVYGLWEVPAGVPGVIDVASTGNVVGTSSAECAPGTFETTFATCKPLNDPHQAAGQGLQNQLAYYSNYGPRIDLAAPGGASKFNVPDWDRGGTPGYPYTKADGTTAFHAFNITSNWTVQNPCFYWLQGNGVFYPGECYLAMEGTSMAAPHVAAAFALAASAHPEMRHRPSLLVTWVRANANTDVHNETQPLSATDTGPAELSSKLCPNGYCHLGGPAIPDSEAYGWGLVDVAAVVR